MSLRDALAAKVRRRAVVPVDVGVTAETTAILAEAEAAYVAEQSDENRAAVEAARSAGRVEVAFRSLDPTEWETVAGKFPAKDGQDGGLDWQAALPVLAALSAEDEDLQDDQWWREQFASGAWSHGDLLRMWQAIFAINAIAPSGYIPKD